MNIEPKNGKVTWQSPSNIAIVKYWGKHGNQLPANPSLSFTLTNAHSTTTVEYDVDPERTAFELSFLFEGKENDKFQKRIANYFKGNSADFPYLKHLKLKVSSENSFPHSAGIASSASAMSALALCLTSIESRMFGGFEGKQQFRTRASHLARLASGSAARSIYGGLVCWGETESVADSSDYFAVPIAEDIDPVFSTFQDAILIVSDEEKPVSSSLGHKLMNNHPYAQMRYYVARNHVEQLKAIMQEGDVKAFGKILENEALALHGLMMNSDPSFILMKPNTLSIIEKIRAVRESEDMPWYFTLDAGPNVHLLYPLEVANRAEELIKSELMPLTSNNQVIFDKVGKGPVKI